MPYDIVEGSLTYTVVDELVTDYRALIIGAVVDALTGKPPLTPITVELHHEGVSVITTRERLFCAAGFVERAFPDPTVAYAVAYRVTAPAYQDPGPLTVNVPAHASFPIWLTPLQLQPLALRLRGRVVKASDRTPMAGALVTTVDAPHSTPASHLVALWQPLTHDHPALTSLQPLVASGPDKLLTQAPVAATLTLSDRLGLQVGTVIQVGAIKGEFGVVQALGPGALNQAGTVDLQTSLAGTYGAGTRVRGLIPPPPAPLPRLVNRANAGDGLVMVDAVLTSPAVEIVDGVNTEYAAVGATTDQDGYYGFSGLRGYETVYLSATAGALQTPEPVPWTLDYLQPVNVVDLQVAA